MAHTTRKRLTSVFLVIAGIAAAAAVFVALVYRATLPALLIFPLILEASGAYGLAENATPGRIHKGLIVNILQWISGIIGLAALFDGVMRIMRQSISSDGDGIVLATDAVLVLLFILWMVVSHLINKDAKERKVCEFC